MNKRIMAVASTLAAASLLGANSSADTVNLVRVVPANDFVLDSSWAGSNKTIIVLGQPNDETVTFPPNCGGVAGQTLENIEVVAILPAVGAFRMTMHTEPGIEIAPGARLSIIFDTRQCCMDASGEEGVSCVEPFLS